MAGWQVQGGPRIPFLLTSNFPGERLLDASCENVIWVGITFFLSRNVDVVALGDVTLVANHSFVLQESVHWQTGVVIYQEKVGIMDENHECIGLVEMNPNGILCQVKSERIIELDG